MHGLVLGSAVGGQELTGQIRDLVAVQGHHHARVLGHGGDHRGFEVLFAGVGQELVHVLGGHVHGHALLGFGDGQLGAVQALVFLGHGVEVREQAVGQLADRHGHATPESIAARSDSRHRRGGTDAAACLLGALPFCTSAPSSSSDSTLCALDEPVAPPMPSRPVRPLSRMILSPGAGVSRRTWSAGVAATTAPTSMRLAT